MFYSANAVIVCHIITKFATFWISKEDIECNSSHPYSVDKIGIVFISEPIVIRLTYQMLFTASKENIKARPFAVTKMYKP